MNLRDLSPILIRHLKKPKTMNVKWFIQSHIVRTWFLAFWFLGQLMLFWGWLPGATYPAIQHPAIQPSNKYVESKLLKCNRSWNAWFLCSMNWLGVESKPFGLIFTSICGVLHLKVYFPIFASPSLEQVHPVISQSICPSCVLCASLVALF